MAYTKKKGWGTYHPKATNRKTKGYTTNHQQIIYKRPLPHIKTPSQKRRELTKEDFSLEREKKMSSKTIQFLSFHIAQKWQRGYCQPQSLLVFFLFGNPFQLLIRSLAVPPKLTLYEIRLLHSPILRGNV